MKKQGIKNYVEVTNVNGGESVEIEDDEHEDIDISDELPI